MLIDFKSGQTGVVLRVKLRSTSSPFGGLTGLTSGSSGLVISTIADNEASTTAYSGSNLETISTLGTFQTPTAGKARFKEVDATNHPGLYEIHIANARYAVTGAKSVLITISGVSGLAECDALVPLRQVNPYDAAAGGMTNLDAQVSTRASQSSIDAGVRLDFSQPTNGLVADDTVGKFFSLHDNTAVLSQVTGLDAGVVNSTAAPNLDAAVSTRLATSGYTAPLSAAGVRTAVGLASADLDTQLGNIPTNSELATAIITGLTTALTEGYRGTGATGSVRDLLYEIIGHLGESSIAGTTKTVKKLDGSTTAKTYTLNDATTPTAITETT